MDLIIDSAFPPCRKCDGKGLIENPLFVQKRGRYGNKIVGAIPITCDSCDGSGMVTQIRQAEFVS